MKKILLPLLAPAMTAATISAADSPKLNYPAAPTDPAAVDTYFGITVPDIYRPLENDTAAATTQWVKAENQLTENYLSKIAYRDGLRNRLSQLFNYKKAGIPSKENDGRYYFYENSGLENQSVLYRKPSIDGAREVFLDPNKLSVDGTVALTGISMSPDGKYTAYTISRSGSDWTEIYLLDTETKQLLPDHIEWAKFTGASWNGNDGFFYSAYDKPTDGKEFSNANENHRIYYHKIGTPQSQDRLFYEDPANPLHFHSAWVPRDSHYIFVFGSGEGFGQSIMYKDLNDPAADWVVFEPSQNVVINPIDAIGDDFYFTTTIDAPKTRLMKASLRNPERGQWQEIIPERPDAVLDGAQFASDKLLVTYSKDASDHVYLYDTDGHLIREVELPFAGSAGFSSDRRHDEVYYNMISYLSPWSHYKYDLASGKSTPIESASLSGIDLNNYITEEIFFPSSDGTRLHAFVTRPKDAKLDGSNPLMLYGYGGFNVALTPRFSPSRLLWLENGGIYVEVNLRGGSEYGEQWHIDGTKLNKLNVFNDFISAAEYLISEGYTSPDKLVINGGSNGGLLVGATTNMRPDLFAVAIPQVGVMDMLRYHLFTIGWNWAPDYGTSADSPEMAKYLYEYSPLHNIKNDGTPYPAVLVTTADHDDRVVPAHSFKYAATLQASDTGSKPKLIRIDSNAGHGAGKPVGKTIDEWTDIYTFTFDNLGITPSLPEAKPAAKPMRVITLPSKSK